MRQVFTSPRLENVERVAELLEQEGIEVRITNGRSYRGNVRANFSYHDGPDKPQPALWIIRSEDQPKARAMLRELGLMDSSRNAPDSFLARSFRGSDPYAATPAQRRSFRYKVGLLLVITVILIMALTHGAKLETGAGIVAAPAPGGAAGATARGTSAAGDAGTATDATAITAVAPADAPLAPANPVVATPPALAERIFADVLPVAGDRVACLAVDGKDATDALLDALGGATARVVPASACTLPRPGQASRHIATNRASVFVEVGAFRPTTADGGRTGTITRNTYGHGQAPVLETLPLIREGAGWTIGEAATTR